MTWAYQYLSKLAVNQFLQENVNKSEAGSVFKDSVMFELLTLPPQYNAGEDNKMMILMSERENHDTEDSQNFP